MVISRLTETCRPQIELPNEPSTRFGCTEVWWIAQFFSWGVWWVQWVNRIQPFRISQCIRPLALRSVLLNLIAMSSMEMIFNGVSKISWKTKIYSDSNTSFDHSSSTRLVDFSTKTAAGGYPVYRTPKSSLEKLVGSRSVLSMIQLTTILETWPQDLATLHQLRWNCYSRKLYIIHVCISSLNRSTHFEWQYNIDTMQIHIQNLRGTISHLKMQLSVENLAALMWMTVLVPDGLR